MKVVWYTTLWIALFLSGCATKQEITSSETYVITIKNKQIALSDTGFINQVYSRAFLYFRGIKRSTSSP